MDKNSLINSYWLKKDKLNLNNKKLLVDQRISKKMKQNEIMVKQLIILVKIMGQQHSIIIELNINRSMLKLRV